MTQLICSNQKCSHMFPFIGTKLIKTYYDDKLYSQDGSLLETTMYCPICKGHYVFEDNEEIPITCPKSKYGCIGKLKQAIVWRMACPKCGRS